MRSFKLLMASGFTLALLTPALLTSTALAQTAPVLECNFPDTIGTCDLSIKKEVNINGSSFSDANSSADAVQAVVGDNLIWKISVTNTSTLGGNPGGTVTVSDVLPAGISYLSSTASEGSYDNSTGKWQFSLPPTGTYPVTLTINTTATSAGTIKNTAAFSSYTPSQCETDCDLTYADGDPENNSDDAFANVSARPQVLAATTGTPQVLALANTGTSTVTETIIAGLLIVVTLLIVGYNRLFDKNRAYKLYR